MPKKYCSGKFGKQRGDVITKSTYGKNILILIKSPSGRVKERLMLTKQNNGTYKVENTGKKEEELEEWTRENKKREVHINEEGKDEEDVERIKEDVLEEVNYKIDINTYYVVILITTFKRNYL